MSETERVLDTKMYLRDKFDTPRPILTPPVDRNNAVQGRVGSAVRDGLKHYKVYAKGDASLYGRNVGPGDRKRNRAATGRVALRS